MVPLFGGRGGGRLVRSGLGENRRVGRKCREGGKYLFVEEGFAGGFGGAGYGGGGGGCWCWRWCCVGHRCGEASRLSAQVGRVYAIVIGTCLVV